MILDIPIQYRAHVIAPRKRNGDDHDLVDTVRVSLRETTQAEAPVVMWWSEHATAVQVAVRSFEGELYTPYGWGKDHSKHAGTTPCDDPGLASRPTPGAEDFDWWGAHESPDPVGLAGLAARLAEGTVHPLRGSMAPSGAPEGKRIDDIPIRQVVSSNLDKQRETWQHAVGRLLSVDGVVYAKASVPVLVVNQRWRAEATVKAAWTDDWSQRFGRGDSAARAFAVTEHDAALAAWRKSRISEKGYDFEYDERGNDPHLTGRLPKPDILRPDLLPDFDSQAFAITQTGRKVLDYLESPHSGGWSSHPHGAPTVATYDRPLMIAYAHLRSALADGSDARTVLDRLVDIREATEAHGTLHNLRDEIARLTDRVSEADADLDAFEGLDGLTDFPGAP